MPAPSARWRTMNGAGSRLRISTPHMGIRCRETTASHRKRMAGSARIPRADRWAAEAVGKKLCRDGAVGPRGPPADIRLKARCLYGAGCFTSSFQSAFSTLVNSLKLLSICSRIFTNSGSFAATPSGCAFASPVSFVTA